MKCHITIVQNIVIGETAEGDRVKKFFEEANHLLLDPGVRCGVHLRINVVVAKPQHTAQSRLHDAALPHISFSVEDKMRLIMLCILANSGYDVKALDDAVVNADIPADELSVNF